MSSAVWAICLRSGHGNGSRRATPSTCKAQAMALLVPLAERLGCEPGKVKEVLDWKMGPDKVPSVIRNALMTFKQ